MHSLFIKAIFCALVIYIYKDLHLLWLVSWAKWSWIQILLLQFIISHSPQKKSNTCAPTAEGPVWI